VQTETTAMVSLERGVSCSLGERVGDGPNWRVEQKATEKQTYDGPTY